MDIEHMSKLIEKIEMRVEKWFFNDLFQMMDNLQGVQPRNEMEIAERRGEKLQVLGPVVEGIENELADDIRRCFAIMARRGMIMPKPRSLMGIPLDIEFDSMIAVAQRAAETAAAERGITVITNLDKSYPDKHIGDNVNWDKTARDYLDKGGFRVANMNSEDDVKAMRLQRQQEMAKQQQQAQAAQAATHTVPALAGAAKDASQIEPGGALNALQIMSGLTPANPASVPQG
jgi:hypothetical protein